MMEPDTARIGKIVVYFRELLDKDLDMDSFGDRIRLQKLTYILQRAGIGLDYPFVWHLRGPYSPSLADDGYTYKEKKEELMFSHALNEKEKQIIEKVRSISGYLKDAENSELLASLLYLSQLLEISGIGLREELKTRKPRFSDADIDRALAMWNHVQANQ